MLKIATKKASLVSMQVINDILNCNAKGQVALSTSSTMK